MTASRDIALQRLHLVPNCVDDDKGKDDKNRSCVFLTAIWATLNLTAVLRHSVIIAALVFEEHHCQRADRLSALGHARAKHGASVPVAEQQHPLGQA